jgi:hypothetical protein
MAINAELFALNPDNPEFKGMMERIAVGIRKASSEIIEGVRDDLKASGLKIAISYLPDSDRIQLIQEGKSPLMFPVLDFIPQVPDGEDAQPGDN